MPRTTAARQPRRCNLAVETDLPMLPVAGTGTLSHVRASRTSRWRASVLVGIHVLIAAHIVHFVMAGRTISPVEPSESMYTLELGYLNCGFLFFAVALAGTLVFGRFFCGWGCHIVALQDFCAWMMKSLGVRPKAFRSRLLAFAPMALALYMFVWPTARRLIVGAPGPVLTNHLTTATFWTTFPGPLYATLTFLACGFAAVYFLGAKGFCTYGCPYGAFFGALDRVSPGRIVVSDACEQCGHCTATCTSNVRVHEEVKRFGMVVDPNCMKCMDCVSVCPKEALSFSFAKPSIARKPFLSAHLRRYDLSLAEELFVVAVAVAATLAFRGLYDGPPLLMSIGLGGVTALLALKLVNLARRRGVTVQNLDLKSAGRMHPSGWAFAGIAGVWLLFTAHSGFVQWHRTWGRWELERTEATREEVLGSIGAPAGASRLAGDPLAGSSNHALPNVAGGGTPGRTYSARHERAAREAERHFALANRWGLAEVAEVKLGLAWLDLLKGDRREAEANIRQAIALSPGSADLHENLIEVLLAEGNLPGAVEAMQVKRAKAGPPSAPDLFRLAGALVELDRTDEAAAAYTACVAAAPESAPARYNFGGLLRRLGRNDEAIEHLRAARALAPSDPDVAVELGLALMAAGGRDHDVEALAELRRAVALAPESPESRMHLPELIHELEARVAQ